jgi:uncharacterized protein (TIGR02231 family)
MSYYHRVYTKPPVSKQVVYSKSQDTIKTLQKQAAAITNELNTNEDILRRITLLIENNFATEQKKQLSSEDLIRLTNYYTDRVKILKDKSYELQLKHEDVYAKINEINIRLNAIPPVVPPGTDNKPTGELILQVMTNAASTANFDITYFTSNAGWIPTYDIRVKTLTNSLKLVYKASVTQSTGLDWKNVKLNLSTSNPNQNSTMPHLTPAFLQLYVPVIYNTMNAPQYMAPGIDKLEEVQITAYSKRSDATAANQNVDLKDISKYTSLKESQLNTNFEIDLPYDIPSDGKAYSISIKDVMVPATYKHYAVPKMDRDAFLVAELNRWDSLSLLPGEANIIMDNVYLGKSFLDPNTTTDTLSLSLGRDKRIAVSRELVKEFRKSSVKGDSKTELFTYEITIKNNKKQPLHIMLKDQYPISKDKEIEVALTKDGGGMVEPDLGILTWNIELQPGESRKVSFSYTVKYPKEKKLRETR